MMITVMVIMMMMMMIMAVLEKMEAARVGATMGWDDGRLWADSMGSESVDVDLDVNRVAW